MVVVSNQLLKVDLTGEHQMSDINELMQRDPLSLTHDDITSLIEEIRKGRTQFNLGVKDETSKTVRKAAKLDLSKLGLSLKPKVS